MFNSRTRSSVPFGPILPKYWITAPFNVRIANALTELCKLAR
jgi:hypothetical protein